MKKFNLSLIVAIIALFTFSGCDKDVISSPVTVSLLPTAHIVGNATAELDLQKAGVETAPVGTMLFVEVFYGNINPAATAGKWSDTITVASDGKYDIAVPADADGVSVIVTPFSFEADQVQSYGAFNNVLKKTFSSVGFSVNVKSGQTIIRDFAYIATNLTSFVDMVRVSGKCLANLNSELPGLENAPNGTVINFYTSDWKDSVAVNNGTYSITVPNKTINYKAQFTSAKRVWVINSDFAQSGYQNVNYKYKLNNSYTPATAINTLDLSFDEGTDMTVDPTPNTTFLSGSASADLDLTIVGFENMPDGTKIYFTTGTWGATAIVSNGKYSLNIPRYVDFNSPAGVLYNISFNANKKTSNTSTAIYNFTASGSTPTVSGATKTLNITAN